MKKDFAIIKLNNTQYIVEKGTKIDTNRIEGKPDKKLIIKEVLLEKKGDKVRIGKPTIKNCKVEAKIVKQFRGKKIKVFKYKAKSRFRKTKGHRQSLTRLIITKI